jgi:predicted nucleic acid-binding protein
LGFDVDGALRWLKPHRRMQPLARRNDEELEWIEGAPLGGGPVLLDTTVYIDLLRGQSSPLLDRFITRRLNNHSAVCLSELTQSLGRLNSADKRTNGVIAAIRSMILDIPAYRIEAPDAQIWGLGGILAGLLFRLGSFGAGMERKCLNDALVFLQARKLGCAVLTANHKDFDYLNQLVPDGRILLYRRTN